MLVLERVDQLVGHHGTGRGRRRLVEDVEPVRCRIVVPHDLLDIEVEQHGPQVECVREQPERLVRPLHPVQLLGAQLLLELGLDERPGIGP